MNTTSTTAPAGSLTGVESPVKSHQPATAVLKAEVEAAKNNITFGDLVRFLLVGAWLTLVMIILCMRGRLKQRLSIRQGFYNRFRRIRLRLFGTQVVTMTQIESDSGYCYTTSISGRLQSDREGLSIVQVYENGLPLQLPHTDHEQIRKVGGGRYSHWGDRLYFSTSDNTDPRTNGRTYTFKEVC